MYRIWTFIKYIFNWFISLFKSKLNIVGYVVPNAVIDIGESSSEYVGNPFGTVVNWGPRFINHFATSGNTTWPEYNDRNKFENRLRHHDRLIQKYKPKQTLKLYLSKKLINYFKKTRSVIYDTTDYFLNIAYNFVFKPKTKKMITHEVPPLPEIEVNDEVKNLKELRSDVKWDNFIYHYAYKKYNEVCINLDNSYYVRCNLYMDNTSIFISYNMGHYHNLYQHMNDTIFIKCDDFNKFEHFILFIRYEVKLANLFWPYYWPNITFCDDSDITKRIVGKEYKKSNNNKLSFFKSKFTFKNNFKKCLIDDYNLYFNSHIGGEVHKLQLNTFFKQVENKEEVLTYEKFNIFKSLDDDGLLNQFNIGYCHFNNEQDKDSKLARRLENDFRIDLPSIGVRNGVPI